MEGSAASGLAVSAGALAGLKVIDLSRVLGGPFCTMILADHGADVIKLEPPQGDETRDWGPPFDTDAGRTASYFIGVNRNKRSGRTFRASCIAASPASARTARSAACPATTRSCKP
jgi:hypothetical protein